jgi:hypothetical protein
MVFPCGRNNEGSSIASTRAPPAPEDRVSPRPCRSPDRDPGVVGDSRTCVEQRGRRSRRRAPEQPMGSASIRRVPRARAARDRLTYEVPVRTHRARHACRRPSRMSCMTSAMRFGSTASRLHAADAVEPLARLGTGLSSSEWPSNFQSAGRWTSSESAMVGRTSVIARAAIHLAPGLTRELHEERDGSTRCD